MLNLMASVSNLIPGPGSAIGLGINLIGSVVELIRGNVDDDLELNFLGSIGNMGSSGDEYIPLKAGKYRIVRRGNGDSNDIAIPVSIHPFKPLPIDEKKKAVVILDSVTLDLKSNLEKYMLNFESSLGSDKPQQFNFKVPVQNKKASLRNVMGIKNKVLYMGPWNVGIPFNFSLSGIRNKEELKALEGIVDQSGKFAGAFTSDDDTEKQIENATKAAQSLRSLIIEFLPKKISVGSMSGFIASEGCVRGDSFSGLENFRLVEPTDDFQEIPDIVLQSKEGGKAILKLKIKFI